MLSLYETSLAIRRTTVSTACLCVYRNIAQGSHVCVCVGMLFMLSINLHKLHKLYTFYSSSIALRINPANSHKSNCNRAHITRPRELSAVVIYKLRIDVCFMHDQANAHAHAHAKSDISHRHVRTCARDALSFT